MLKDVLRATSTALPIVVVLPAVLAGCIGAEAQESPEPAVASVAESLSPKSPGPAFCGGIAGIPCPAGQVCIDAPNDSCSPTCGGVDCGGICVTIVPPRCGGFAGIPCPPGSACIDVPGDGCNVMCGGADCGGVCVTRTPAPILACGGITGRLCPAPLYCADNPGDHCNPDCGGADCGGICL